MRMSTYYLRSRVRTVKNQKSNQENKGCIRKCETTMEDIPPEVLTIILEQLTLNEPRNNILGYRVVSSLWKNLIDSLITKKITSGEFLPFPEMLTGDQGGNNQLSINNCPATLRNSRNPFPFGSASLTARGTIHSVYFGAIMASFGSNLTTFAIQDQPIHLTLLASVLGTMPNLKLLSLSDVELSNDFTNFADTLLPTPPPLPCLSNLELKSNSLLDRHQVQVLYLWLICACAEQLVRLKLESQRPFPALQRQHRYTHLFNGYLIRIGKTSDSAFGKLKELNISRPGKDFLNNSETPVLQQLCVNGLAREPTVDLRSLVHFVVKCQNVIETLTLNVNWNELVSAESLKTNRNDGTLLKTEGVVAPNLKTLTMHYPSDKILVQDEEKVLSDELLVMFPALRTLRLLHFLPDGFQHALCDFEEKDEHQEEVVEVVNQNERASEISNLKDSLAEHWKLLRVSSGGFWGVIMINMDRNEEHGLFMIRRGKQVLAAFGLPPNLDVERFSDTMDNTRDRMVRIFRRLAGLGEKREKVIAEQLIRRRRFWNICPNLRIVSVSSGAKSDGDICLVRRPDED